MESSLLLFRPKASEDVKTNRLQQVLDYAFQGISYDPIEFANQLSPLNNRKILFAIDLGNSGINFEYYHFLKWLRTHSNSLCGCTAAILVDGGSELYTKSIASELVFSANLAGCAFVGRPLVEGTRTLDNFTILSQNMGTDSFGAYQESARILVKRLLENSFPVHKRPNILALHASIRQTSNTLALWQQVKIKIENSCDLTEINVRNGAVSDCAGCPYTTCLHFGEEGRCFYGGVMVEQVFPAIKKADALVMLCPNYNDAISANLTALVNRLTALFRQTRFYDKAVFAIIVSGYSGSDLIARQLIAALNMNKSFYLPGNFAMLETANNAGTALKLPGIDDRIEFFCDQIILVLKGSSSL